MKVLRLRKQQFSLFGEREKQESIGVRDIPEEGILFTREVANALEDKGRRVTRYIVRLLNEKSGWRFIITDEVSRVMQKYRSRKDKPLYVTNETFIYQFTCTCLIDRNEGTLFFPFLFSAEYHIRADGNVNYIACHTSLPAGVVARQWSDIINVLPHGAVVPPEEAVQQTLVCLQRILEGMRRVSVHEATLPYKYAAARIMVPLQRKLHWFIHKCGFQDVEFWAWSESQYTGACLPLSVVHYYSLHADYDYENGYLCYEIPFTIKFRRRANPPRGSVVVLAKCFLTLCYDYRRAEVLPHVFIEVRIEVLEEGEPMRTLRRRVEQCSYNEWVDKLIAIIDEEMGLLYAREYHEARVAREVQELTKPKMDNLVYFVWVSATLSVANYIIRAYTTEGAVATPGSVRIDSTALNKGDIQVRLTPTTYPVIVVNCTEASAPRVDISMVVRRVRGGVEVKSIVVELVDVVDEGYVLHSVNKTYSAGAVVLRSVEDAARFGGQLGAELVTGARSVLDTKIAYYYRKVSQTPLDVGMYAWKLVNTKYVLRDWAQFVSAGDRGVTTDAER